MGELINWMGGWPREGLMAQTEWEERVAEASERDREPDAGKTERHIRAATTQSRLGEHMAAAGWLRDGAADSGGFAVTAGADAAIERVARGWLRPGDAVLTENPTGRSALRLIRKAGANPYPVRSDEAGMLPDDLSEALARLRPRLVYAAPAGTDPQGRTWSSERREALLASCREAGVAVLLDERQGMLNFDATKGTEAVSRERNDAGGTVFTVGELPPGTIAGTRLGWLAASGDAKSTRAVLAGAHADAAEGTEAPSPALTPSEAEQRALLALMEERGAEPLVEMMRFVCQARIGLLCELLGNSRLPGLNWREPEAGMHLWLSLPEGLDGDALLRAAWREGLLFQPGGDFYATEPNRFRIRMTVVHSEEREIRMGVHRLGEAMAGFLGRSAR
ncbi:aminotransferase class I/II-fold pyridoxal phosphate-dependent enzyme [Cohnella zeiphila]|uniref:PLP-dependent aminotransferase family protein n=1 Tax=Cohnella zeiphila TaxID=2761120 RepID=A0A7X0SJS7_9BACL|nr:PLP-dependent aminotransferase family protein [Cohnella zeiphila]MBB6731171.1 PLP-dependent aminotransferase family protein [Cohnella zeiphila]